MTKRSTGPRAMAGSCVVLCMLLFQAAAAQVTPPPRPRPDSLRLDTTRAAPDSSRLLADSITPPRVIAKHARGGEPGFGAGIWIWERDDLMREGALSLSDLLQQIPSVTPYRAGLILQPEIASAFGQTRGRVQVILDGYELDPLLESTHDFARIELGQLQRVKVERRLDITRIELLSLEPTDGRPHSGIEAGVGEPDANLFRGVFLAPKLFIGPLGFALERLDTDGMRGREPAENSAGWAKWAWIRGGAGIQAEFRQASLQRAEASPWLSNGKRRDVIVRARASPSANLVAELFAGKSTFENDTVTIANDSVDIPIPQAEVMQYGGRVSYQSPVIWADLAARIRDHDALPSTQIEVGAGGRLGGIGSLMLSWTQSDWRDAGSASSYNLRAVSGAFRGLHAFGEFTGGKLGGPGSRFALGDTVLLSERTGTRLGGGFTRWGGFVNAALVSFKSDSVQSFGLPFDSTDQRFRGAEDLLGWEIDWSVPLRLKGLSTLGSFTNWPKGTVPIYLPNQVWRAALQYHNTPLKSGNLELLGRLEMRHRGLMVAPARTVATTGIRAVWETSVVPAYDQLDGYLQIRIIDVRIFIRAENLRNEPIPELPGRIITGPRLLYGVKWIFWN